MSDFLTNLAARSLGRGSLLRPRLPTLFGPVTADAPNFGAEIRTPDKPTAPSLIEPRSMLESQIPAPPNRTVEEPIRTGSPAPAQHLESKKTGRESVQPAQGVPQRREKDPVEAMPPRQSSVLFSSWPAESQVFAPQAIRLVEQVTPVPVGMVRDKSVKGDERPPAQREIDVARQREARWQSAEKLKPTTIPPGESRVAEPAIQVTIGHLEVRASVASKPVPSRQPAAVPGIEGLQEYLRQRGRRRT